MKTSEERAKFAAELLYSAFSFGVYTTVIGALLGSLFIFVEWEIASVIYEVAILGIVMLISLIVGVVAGGGTHLLDNSEEGMEYLTARRANRQRIEAQEGMLTEVVDNGDLTGAVTISVDAEAGDLNIYEEE